MAKRPVLKKRANKLRKAFRSELPAFIDLVAYLKERGYAQTTGEAEKIILAGRVRSESHKLGIGKGKKLREASRLKAALGRTITEDDLEDVEVVERHVSARFRGTIQVMLA